MIDIDVYHPDQGDKIPYGFMPISNKTIRGEQIPLHASSTSSGFHGVQICYRIDLHYFNRLLHEGCRHCAVDEVEGSDENDVSEEEYYGLILPLISTCHTQHDAMVSIGLNYLWLVFEEGLLVSHISL